MSDLEEMLMSVWRQALVEDAKLVEVEGHRYPVHRTSRRRLREVDFDSAGEGIRGLESLSAQWE